MADQTENGGADGATTSRSSATSADREAFLSWNKEEGGDEKPIDSSKDDDADDRDDVDLDDADDDDTDVDVDEDDDDLDDVDDDKDEKDVKGEEKPDADTAKRLEAVRRREQRSRDQLATERKGFEKERDAFVAEWKPRMAAAEKFEALKARGVNAYNAVDVLRELGMPEKDYEQAAQHIFALSEKGKADPRHAAAIERAKKERERDDEVATLKKRLEDREEAEKRSAEEEKVTRAVNTYLDGLAKAAPTGTLAAHDLGKEPKKTRHRLGRIATKLTEKTGEVPTAKRVIARYEKIRAKELGALGVDIAKFTKAAPAKGTTVVGDKKTAKSKAADDDETKPLTRAEFIAVSKRD